MARIPRVCCSEVLCLLALSLWLGSLPSGLLALITDGVHRQMGSGTKRTLAPAGPGRRSPFLQTWIPLSRMKWLEKRRGIKRRAWVE